MLKAAHPRIERHSEQATHCNLIRPGFASEGQAARVVEGELVEQWRDARTTSTPDDSLRKERRGTTKNRFSWGGGKDGRSKQSGTGLSMKALIKPDKYARSGERIIFETSSRVYRHPSSARSRTSRHNADPGPRDNVPH